jgi:hypothetical protein
MADSWRVAEVLFAGGVFVFAGVAAGISYYQWQVADKAASAARDSADAAKIAAQSAERANQLSQQSLVITESPYVYNKGFALKPLKVGQKATVTCEIEKLSFDSALLVDFQGARVTSDGGLILVRELDERLGLSALWNDT